MTEKEKKERDDFEKSLLDAGYRKFKDQLYNAQYGLQKRIVDENGTRFFINCYRYNPAESYNLEETHDYTFKVQFTKFEETKDQTIDMSFSATWFKNQYNRELTSLEDVEDFFNAMWSNNNFDYYEFS
jgi:maltodextrin utilization protein YvdJ